MVAAHVIRVWIELRFRIKFRIWRRIRSSGATCSDTTCTGADSIRRQRIRVGLWLGRHNAPICPASRRLRLRLRLGKWLGGRIRLWFRIGLGQRIWVRLRQWLRFGIRFRLGQRLWLELGIRGRTCA